jgi:hypothetical protein
MKNSYFAQEHHAKLQPRKCFQPSPYLLRQPQTLSAGRVQLFFRSGRPVPEDVVCVNALGCAFTLRRMGGAGRSHPFCFAYIPPFMAFDFILAAVAAFPFQNSGAAAAISSGGLLSSGRKWLMTVSVLSALSATALTNAS